MSVKRAILAACAALLCINKGNAQVQYLPPTVKPFTFSVGGGITTLYGDVPDKKPLKPAVRGNFDYNITPFIAAGIEAQYGKMAEGFETATVATENKPLFVESTYYTANVNARVSFGMVNQNATTFMGRLLNGIYFGAGVGYLHGDFENQTKVFPETGQPITAVSNDALKSEANEWLVPMNLGLNLDMPYSLGAHNITLNINYQYNQAFGESLDGYNFNYYTHEVGMKDAYSFLSVALRFHFGKMR